MNFRIVCTGDIHLGSAASTVPDAVDVAGISPRAAWARCVQFALREQVDAVALTGDIVDSSNCFYESFGPLLDGVQRLVTAGIDVVAVAGNHDHDVLARLATMVPQFRLLGRGGKWEETTIEKSGKAAVRVQGWSFPARHVETNPLLTHPGIEHGVATIGLLHCDCGVSSSPYAPVPLAELRARPVTAWLLGHNHSPQCVADGNPLILYPGSPQGLDPGEPGVHGIWLVTVRTAHDADAEFVPLAHLQWEHIPVPLNGLPDANALEAAITRSIQTHHEQRQAEASAAKAVGCRLFLRGRTSLSPADLARAARAAEDALVANLDGILYFVEKVENESRPDVVLEDLARAHDPVGFLAQRLIVLERQEPATEYERLLRNAGKYLDRDLARPAFALLQKELPQTGGDIAQLLLREGYELLELLLAQKPAEDDEA